MEPLGLETGNSGIGVQRGSAAYETKLPVLERREVFQRRHPEIDIRARREGGELRIYVREPHDPQSTVWTDADAMMTHLEARYPDEETEAGA